MAVRPSQSGASSRPTDLVSSVCRLRAHKGATWYEGGPRLASPLTEVARQVCVSFGIRPPAMRARISPHRSNQDRSRGDGAHLAVQVPSVAGEGLVAVAPIGAIADLGPSAATLQRPRWSRSARAWHRPQQVAVCAARRFSPGVPIEPSNHCWQRRGSQP